MAKRGCILKTISSAHLVRRDKSKDVKTITHSESVVKGNE